MKRWIALLTTFLLLWTALPVAAEGLPERAEDVIARLAGELPLLLGNGAYVDIYTGAWVEDFDPAISALARNTWQQPICTVYLSCDEERLLTETGVGAEAADVMRPYIPQVLVSLVRGNMEHDAMLINTIGQNSDHYVDESMPEGTIVFLRFYADGAPLIGVVTAYRGAVSVSMGVIAGSDGLEQCRTVAEVQAWLDARGMGGILAGEAPVMLPVPAAAVNGDTEPARAADLARLCVAQMAHPLYLMARDPAEVIGYQIKPEEYDTLRLALYTELELRTHGILCYAGSVPLALANDSGAVERRLTQRLTGSCLGMLVSRYGGMKETLAMSVSTVETFYADPAREDGTGVYMFFYEGGGAVMVSVTASNGVVGMSAQLMPLAELARCQSALEASLWFAGKGFPFVCAEVNAE